MASFMNYSSIDFGMIWYHNVAGLVST
jgi:hypothetical protein